MNQILIFLLLAATASAETIRAHNKPGNVCPNTPEISLIADPKSCSQFYVCVGDQVNSYRCTKGYEFSPSEKNCVPISNNGCTAIAHPGPPTTTTPAGPTMKPICQNPVGTLIVIEPHETDCTKFWACDPYGDDHMLLDCAEGYEFNMDLWLCTPIAPGGCLDQQKSKTTLNPLE